jgi:hypothetical protein
MITSLDMEITNIVSSDKFLERINECISVPQLLELFENSTAQREAYLDQFTKRRKELMNGNQSPHKQIN